MILSPKISVILPVYNGEKYLKQSIESILSQTYKNFELLIINDGSEDGSLSIIKNVEDNRIKVFNQKNQGLAATLNRGIRLSKGEYLARQDQDDVSLPDRFQKQVSYLNLHPKCGMVGTWAGIISKNGENSGRYHKHPIESEILRLDLLFDNPFVHSSVMIRKNVFKIVGGYSINERWQPPEDYELWSRLSRKFDVANIPEVLQLYREVHGSMSRVGFRSRVIKISSRNIGWLLHRKYTDPEIYNTAAVARGELDMLKNGLNLPRINKILNQIKDVYKRDNKSEEYVNRINDIKKRMMLEVYKYYRNKLIVKIKHYLNY